MTKRFRQASFSFESLVVAVKDSEDLQVQAEASTAIVLVISLMPR